MNDELDRLAAAVLLPSFPAPEAPDWLLGWLERGVAGVVLFSNNIRDRCFLVQCWNDDETGIAQPVRMCSTVNLSFFERPNHDSESRSDRVYSASTERRSSSCA